MWREEREANRENIRDSGGDMEQKSKAEEQKKIKKRGGISKRHRGFQGQER